MLGPRGVGGASARVPAAGGTVWASCRTVFGSWSPLCLLAGFLDDFFWQQTNSKSVWGEWVWPGLGGGGLGTVLGSEFAQLGGGPFVHLDP